MSDRKPPSPWEVWVAAGLLVIYFSNFVNSSERNAEVSPANDLFLFVGITWLIAIAVRFQRFKSSRSKPEVAKSFPPPVVQAPSREPLDSDPVEQNVMFAPPSPLPPVPLSAVSAASEEEARLAPNVPNDGRDETSRMPESKEAVLLAETTAFSEIAFEHSFSQGEGSLRLDSENLIFRALRPPHLAQTYQLVAIKSANLENALALGASWLVVQVEGKGPVRFRIPTRNSTAFHSSLVSALRDTKSAG